MLHTFLVKRLLFNKILILVLTIQFCAISQNKITTDTKRIAGFRASRILESYPNNQFPTADYWANTGAAIAQKFSGSAPSGIWIVSIFEDTGYTTVNFPSAVSYPYMNFINTDENEAYLSKFDDAGINIWLQIEPGAASIDTLVSIVLKRYKHHSCVKGFGIDVEWNQYDASKYPDGKKVTNAEAQKWESEVKAIDTSYTLFLKHYDTGWMPTTYRGDIIFVDDSQDFNWSSTPLDDFISEFRTWGKKFSPNKTAFQIGYEADSTWWKKFNDPVKTIGDTLFSQISNCYGVFWVDFTITKVFPVTGINENQMHAQHFNLYQNYPNPFNPATLIQYELSHSDKVLLKIYDILGNEIRTLVNEDQSAGKHSITFKASGVSSGMYFYTLQSGGTTMTKKMILVK